MAWIHRRAPGTWEVVLFLGRDPGTGKRERRSFTVQGTKKQALAAAAAQEAAISGGTFVDPSTETVEEFMRRWLRDYVEPSLALRTQQRYREIVEYDILPDLGRIPLQKLRPSHVIAMLGRRRAAGNRKTGTGLGPSSLQKVYAVVHRAMEHAVRWQAIPVNPVDAVDRPVIPRQSVDVLTPDQARALLQALRGKPYEVALRVALLCGVRLSELLALRWRDIDWEHECLMVRQALDLPAADGTPRFKATKTHRGERPVSLPTQLVEQLREHRAAQLEARRVAPMWAPFDLVFTDAIGRPIWGNTLRRDYYRVLAEAGLPRVMLHGLRHSMATLMLAAGEHPKVVSERMGHSSVAFTLATYSHVMPGMHGKAAQRLANILEGAETTTTRAEVVEP